VFRSYKEKKGGLYGVTCEACNRKNHSATYHVILEGQSYDSRAFWNGNMKDNPPPNTPAEEKTYRLGVHCHDRTELYHRLQHYKYILNTKVKKALDNVDAPSQKPQEVLSLLLNNKKWVKMFYEQFNSLRNETSDYGIDETT